MWPKYDAKVSTPPSGEYQEKLELYHQKKAKYYMGVLCLSFMIETDLLYTNK